MANILVLHGPNLNLLGQRNQKQYGTHTLDEINDHLTTAASQMGHELRNAQSNSEEALIEHVQQTPKHSIDFIIINPAAFTHTSIAIRDALSAVEIPFIEVHLSNIYARETFRAKSFFSDIAYGVISGFGSQSYILALQAAHHFLTGESNPNGHS